MQRPRFPISDAVLVVWAVFVGWKEFSLIGVGWQFEVARAHDRYACGGSQFVNVVAPPTFAMATIWQSNFNLAHVSGPFPGLFFSI
ncbi:hypothetical protein [Candidatus Palauibacter sp.]|uniref:hypothetical protein n=1 Tax=Candidatus Palauibacter sp. TaxID=3101350 RepID=UPI003B5BF5EF